MMNTEDKIRNQIESNALLLYMKGTPDFPQCGFSGQVAAIMERLGAKLAYVNVLENPDIRQTLPKVADWPTFPQLWLNQELLGGCDIVTQMYQSGDLKKMLDEAGVTGDQLEVIEA